MNERRKQLYLVGGLVEKDVFVVEGLAAEKRGRGVVVIWLYSRHEAGDGSEC